MLSKVSILNVLSLFDGCACGLQALKQAGINVDAYFASEVDKHAIEIAKKNHPEIIHLGDITRWRNWELPRIDLLMGGSPCQGFSSAGKGLNFEDPRSKLFFAYADIQRHCKPSHFLLENVKMKPEWRGIISDELGVPPVEINSALLSAQNRKRLYWCNWQIEQPEDKRLVLSDILEAGGSSCQQSFDGHEWGAIFKKNYVQWDKHGKGHGSQDQRAFYLDGKHGTLTSGRGQTKVKVLMNPRIKGVSVKEGRIRPHRGDARKSGLGEIGTIRPIDQQGGACISSHVQFVHDYVSYRRLTPLECERLQTMPDNYTEGVSDAQRYKIIGNGWTVAVIQHILESMLD